MNTITIGASFYKKAEHYARKHNVSIRDVVEDAIVRVTAADGHYHIKSE